MINAVKKFFRKKKPSGKLRYSFTLRHTGYLNPYNSMMNLRLASKNGVDGSMIDPLFVQTMTDNLFKGRLSAGEKRQFIEALVSGDVLIESTTGNPDVDGTCRIVFFTDKPAKI